MKPAPLPDLHRSRNRALYVVFFLAIFGALDFGYYLTRDTFVERLLIDTCTVRPAAAIIDALSPAESARASGHSLLTSFGQINILGGCEGSDGMFLLIAAVLPYPAGWRAKLAGVIGGVGLMYLLNQVRILVLVLSLHWHRDWFASLHGFIAPTCIVVIGGIYFLVWTNTVEDRVQT